MPYQQTSQCRFYVCSLQWLKSLGLLSAYNDQGSFDAGYSPEYNPMDMIGINPTIPYRLFSVNGGAVQWSFEYPSTHLFSDKSWFALLGHNLAVQASTGNSVYIWSLAGTAPLANIGDSVNIIGADTAGTVRQNGYDGYSFMTFDWSGDNLPSTMFDIKFDLYNFADLVLCNTLCMGTYYEMPHSPDLSLTLNYEYGGSKTIETRGGSSLSNTTWTKQPNWNNGGAWELYEEFSDNMDIQQFSRSGRKVWNLSFSFLDDGDIFGSNSSVSFADFTQFGLTADNFDLSDTSNNNFKYNLLNDDNFFSQVVHKTLGAGNLPFIFQPDKEDFSNMAICKFDQQNISFQQKSPSLYSVQMKIREVW